MGNIANDPSVTGPSWDSWGSQLQADTRDVYESKLAQAKALHQVQQLNEQFYMQERQREAAQQRLDAAREDQQREQRLQQSFATRQAVQMQNAANVSSYWAQNNFGIVKPFSTPGRLSNSRLGGSPGVLGSGGRSSGGSWNLRSPRTMETMRASSFSGGGYNDPNPAALNPLTPDGGGNTIHIEPPNIYM